LLARSEMFVVSVERKHFLLQRSNTRYAAPRGAELSWAQAYKHFAPGGAIHPGTQTIFRRLQKRIRESTF